MVEKVRACEQRIGNKWKPARVPMYNRNGVRLYLGISRNSYLFTLPRKPYRMRIMNWHLDKEMQDIIIR